MAKKVTAACDQCVKFHKRCDGKQTCSRCFSKNECCTYLIMKKKRGRKNVKCKISVVNSTENAFIDAAWTLVCMNNM